MKPLKVLLIDDSEDDAIIIGLKLQENSIAFVKWVSGKHTFLEQLKNPWDVILVDFRLVGMTGEEAIQLARQAAPETPVIIVSGSINHKEASVALQLGAVDAVMKGEELERLPSAVQRAAETAQVRRENEDRKKREMNGQRLEALGEMVGGLSHDLRNVLSIILAGVEIIRPKLVSDEQRILDVMTSSVRRAEQMLVQILAFGRGDSGELHKVSTEYVVGEIATLLRAGTFPTNILVKITTAMGTAQIQCNENQLNRALWNLCLNARDAMPGGGQLTIAAQNITQPEGQFVLISISDTGSGIPKEAMGRIFEPFFTTKGNKGTGLGLAMTQQIIAAHGGKIGVTSGATGTEFQIYLPVAGDVKNNVPQFNGCGKTILLVEDEDFLRAWGKLRLENANYRVLDAPNGAAAMNLFLAHLDEVDALVTDLNMPVMTGDKLATALLELNKDLKIVYITGLTEAATYQPVPSAILEKPFASVRLLETLDNILS